MCSSARNSEMIQEMSDSLDKMVMLSTKYTINIYLINNISYNTT